jgi:hypothetical protein
MTTSQAAPLRPRGRTPQLALIALCVACLIPVIWPGDIPFINDEPLLIVKAVNANREGQLASMGLLGTYGFTYGPAPTWVYQALVAVHRDLIVVAVLHTLLLSGLTAVALWWLSRSLKLWVWFAPVPLLSPYFWFYARVLWDNPFLIPLGALAMAGYAAHLESESPVGLRVSVAAMAAIPLVHLMGIALVLPLAAHMLVVRWRALWRHKLSVGMILAAALTLAWPYWVYRLTSHPPSPGAGSSHAGWFFPLAGGRLLSATWLDYFYGKAPVQGPVFRMAAVISSLAYVLVGTGIGVALFSAVRAVRSRTWTTRAHVTAIAIATLVCQAFIDGISAKYDHPHYQNATWISFVLLAWLTIDVAERRRITRRLAFIGTGLLASSLLASEGALLVGLHLSRGTREVYGPTLANQQEVARALARYAPSSDVQNQVSLYERFPHTLEILRQLNPGRRADRPQRRLELRYVSKDPLSGAIQLVER